MVFKVSHVNKFPLDYYVKSVSSLVWLMTLYCFCLYFYLPQDTSNRKSNQQNLGTIKSSNLCTEIIEYTSPTETAVCNLASIALPRFIREKVSNSLSTSKLIFLWLCYLWFKFALLSFRVFQ